MTEHEELDAMRKCERLETKLDKIRGVIQSNYNVAILSEQLAKAIGNDTAEAAAMALRVTMESLMKQLHDEELLF